MNLIKSIFLISLILFLTLSTYAETKIIHKDINLSINNAFVPENFDSNSEAYAIVSGIFPNGCYKWKGFALNNISAFEHEVTSVATVSQGMCIQVLIPFTKEIQLGTLQTGTHTLHFLSQDRTFLEKIFTVK